MTPDEARAKELLERYKRKQLELALDPEFAEHGWVPIVGMIDVSEGLTRRALRTDPTPRPILVERLVAMLVHVSADDFALLADLLERHGFTVTRQPAEMPGPTH